MLESQTFIFAGRSGSGKGTQVEFLQQYLKDKSDKKQFHYYAGDGFRAFMEGDTYTQNLTRKIQESGGLQPEFLAILLWASSFIDNLKGDEHLFIDGSPRRLVESEALYSALKFYKREKPRVILINVSKDESRKRLLARGRHDDKGEALERRLSWFDEHVYPAMMFYKDKPDYVFVEVNGEQAPDRVFEDILRGIRI